MRSRMGGGTAAQSGREAARGWPSRSIRKPVVVMEPWGTGRGVKVRDPKEKGPVME